jgi:CHASE2 domain-containing sensor protein
MTKSVRIVLAVLMALVTIVCLGFGIFLLVSGHFGPAIPLFLLAGVFGLFFVLDVMKLRN